MAFDRTRFRGWRYSMWAALLLLGGGSLWAETGTASWPAVWKEWFKNMAPEFVAALSIALFVQWYLQEDDRKRYVNAMQSIRRAVSKRKLHKDDARALMGEVVPQVSVLYFGSTRPAPEHEGDWQHDRPTDCRTCFEPHEPVADGRCTRCFDLVDSWKSR